MNEAISQYIATGKGENASQAEANALIHKLGVLGFTVTGTFADAGGRVMTPIAELVAQGLQPEDRIFMHIQIAGHDDYYTVSQSAKVLADGSPYAVREFIAQSFPGDPTAATLTAITGVPAVQAALKSALG